jgi:hypothetical protein
LGFDLHPLCYLNLLANYPDISYLIKNLLRWGHQYNKLCYLIGIFRLKWSLIINVAYSYMNLLVAKVILTAAWIYLSPVLDILFILQVQQNLTYCLKAVLPLLSGYMYYTTS